MPLQTISATDLRTRTREIMQRVRFQDEVFLVENFGQPMAVVLSPKVYEHLTKTCMDASIQDALIPDWSRSSK
ncbi:MAG: hypothetical protein HY741_14150 [Chloroflexi bacterium]|nr:hypothetical protein [Chloroflexota bacterium]